MNEETQTGHADVAQQHRARACLGRAHAEGDDSASQRSRNTDVAVVETLFGAPRSLPISPRNRGSNPHEMVWCVDAAIKRSTSRADTHLGGRTPKGMSL